MENTQKKLGRPAGAKNKVKTNRRVVTKITNEITDAICEGIKLGMSFKGAAALAGVAEQTFNAWMKSAREGDKVYSYLLEKMEYSLEFSKRIHLGYIHKHATGGFKTTKLQVKYDAEGKITEKTETTEEVLPNLRASTWLLERRHPKEFGPRQEIAIGNTDNPFEISLFGQALMGSGEGEFISHPEENGEQLV